MILKVFSVYDIKAEYFSAPFFMNSNGEAVRAFKDLANDSSTTIGKHPEDYRLMCLGEFDNVSGDFNTSQPASLGFATDYVNLPSNAVPIGVVKGVA